MTSHSWHFEVSDRARKQIDELPSPDRMAVFRRLARVLGTPDHPVSLPEVRKLVDPNLPGAYRIRQGDYRIFIDVEAGEIVHQKFTYKGKIIV